MTAEESVLKLHALAAQIAAKVSDIETYAVDLFWQRFAEIERVFRCALPLRPFGEGADAPLGEASFTWDGVRISSLALGKRYMPAAELQAALVRLIHRGIDVLEQQGGVRGR